MKKSKKILALLIAVIMLATMLPPTVFAEDLGGFSIEGNSRETYIVSYDGSEKNLTIPSWLNKRPVVGIKSLGKSPTVESVTIPDNIEIAEGAFSNCTSLTSIIVYDTNTKYCSDNGILFNKDKTSIFQYPAGKTDKSYSIPNSVTSIGRAAFKGCISLTNISIPNSITSIGNSVFENCTSLTSVSIPDSVKNIGDSVFSNCTSLPKVGIPNSVISIGDSAFSGCTSLKNVTIPDSVTNIEYGVFSGCTSLESVTIGNCVTSIGDWVFKDCYSLREINVSVDNMAYSSLDGVLFNKDKTELICYPDGKADKSYQILNSVKNVVNNAFNNCIFLEKITIPNSVIRIGDWTFSGCTSLKNVEIGKGVTTIGYEAFVDCTSLKSITIPKDVTEIEDFAFGYTYEKPKILQFFGIETYGGWDGPEYKIPGFTIYGEKGTEAERYAKDNDFKFIEVTETIPGDVSGDGVVSANDAIVIQRHIVGLETLGEAQLKNADLNGDGIVDEGDAIAILRIDAGLAS